MYQTANFSISEHWFLGRRPQFPIPYNWTGTEVATRDSNPSTRFGILFISRNLKLETW